MRTKRTLRAKSRAGGSTMKRLITLILSLAMIISGSAAAFAETPTIIAPEPSIFLYYSITVGELKADKGYHVRFDVADDYKGGQLVLWGKAYTDMDREYITDQDSLKLEEPGEQGVYLKGGYAYSLKMMSASSDGTYLADGADSQVLSYSASYALTDKRAASAADYPSHTKAIYTMTVQNSAQDVIFTDKYELDGKSVTEKEYTKYKESHPYREKVSSVLTGSTDPVLTGSEKILSKITFTDADTGKATAVEFDSDENILTALGKRGVISYSYTVTEQYSFTDNYERLHKLTTVETPAPAKEETTADPEAKETGEPAKETTVNEDSKPESAAKETTPAENAGTGEASKAAEKTAKSKTTTTALAKASITSLKGGKKSFTVKWKKLSKAKLKKIKGYQIQYSRNKNFKNAKTVYVKKGKTSRKIRKLTSGKRYYVRVRTVNGKKHGAWSKYKKVTVK